MSFILALGIVLAPCFLGLSFSILKEQNKTVSEECGVILRDWVPYFSCCASHRLFCSPVSLSIEMLWKRCHFLFFSPFQQKRI